MPLQATSGAASYDAFGGGVPVAPNYIEEVFSTWLYTGNGSTQTITNGIDLSTKGGLVWIKIRGTSVQDHALYDTARTARYKLSSNLTSAQVDTGTGTDKDFASFNSTGFSLGTPYYSDDVNGNSYPYASWTFRKQPKFFDIVTWTGNGSNRTISHSLGSVPASIWVKRTDTTGAWQVYHRSLANTEYLVLNSTAEKATGATRWNSTTPTSTVFSVGTDATVNASGGTYVAYIFAHDAGGFGLTGTDNVISCGSYTGNGSANGPTVTLGYEPQWMLVKNTTEAGDWYLVDVMRGWTALTSGNNINYLNSNTTNTENTDGAFAVTSTGFKMTVSTAAFNNSGSTYIYIAIRRGPMKVPTSGTSVFTPLAYTNSTGGVTISSLTFPADLVITDRRNVSSNRAFWDRLRSATKAIYSNLTNAEGTVGDGLSSFASNVGYTTGSGGGADNTVDGSQINWIFRRAPSFFDEVCYTGTGSARTVSHNLGVAPEMMIVKNRSIASDWRAYSANLGATQNLKPNTTDAATSSTLIWNDTTPTSSVFSVGTSAGVNGSGNNHVAYLFATCAGVSKVGSYTGTATTKQIDCGFTAGARFVLIKRTDSTGDWYVWDTARGIVSGNDSYLLLNSTAAEVTNTDYIDTYSAGFEISSTAPAAINASGGTFIFLAIA